MTLLEYLEKAGGDTVDGMYVAGLTPRLSRAEIRSQLKALMRDGTVRLLKTHRLRAIKSDSRIDGKPQPAVPSVEYYFLTRR